MASKANDKLHRAARSGDVAGIAAALLAGADPNAFEGMDEWTPLRSATHNGLVAAIAALLVAGARVDGADSIGNTPLMVAVLRGSTAALDALLAAGADVHHVNNGGYTALHLASNGGHPDATRVLLEAGARTDVRNKSGKRPIDAVSAQLARSLDVAAQSPCPVAVRRCGRKMRPARQPCAPCSPPLHRGPAAGPSHSPATRWSGSGRREARGWRWWMCDVTC
jgi:ankyrin repeat protein